MNNWQLVLNNAKKAFETDTVWTSFALKRKYRVTSINEKKIIIEKVSGGNDVLLAKTTIENAANKLRKQKRIARDKLLGSVARETTLSYFHPFIFFDRKTKELC